MLYEDELDQAIARSRAAKNLAEIKRKLRGCTETFERIDSKTIKVHYTKPSNHDGKNSKNTQ